MTSLQQRLAQDGASWKLFGLLSACLNDVISMVDEEMLCSRGLQSFSCGWSSLILEREH